MSFFSIYDKADHILKSYSQNMEYLLVEKKTLSSLGRLQTRLEIANKFGDGKQEKVTTASTA